MSSLRLRSDPRIQTDSLSIAHWGVSYRSGLVLLSGPCWRPC